MHDGVIIALCSESVVHNAVKGASGGGANTRGAYDIKVSGAGSKKGECRVSVGMVHFSGSSELSSFL